MIKKNLFLLYVVTYVILIIIFSVWWTHNFVEYVTAKGDEFEGCIKFLVPLTYVLFFIIQFSVKRRRIIIVLLIPVLIAVASFFLGIFFLRITGIRGVPNQIIYLYCVIYTILAVGSAMIVYKPLKSI